MDLVLVSQEIMTAARRLSNASDALYKLGEAKASSEQVYRVKLSQEMLKLKSEGMSIGMIADVARGNVGEYLFARDVAEIRWKAAIESVDAIRSQLPALQSILKYQEHVA